MMHTLHIKNMVCRRCLLVVRQELEKLNMVPAAVRLGEVDLPEIPSPEQTQLVRKKLREFGFELLDDKKDKLIEQIKNIVVQLVHYEEDTLKKVNISDFLSDKTGRDYNFLSHLFSSVEGITIEKYVILQKIEKVKELLVYNELTLSEIAFQMGYSSVQYLSNQFKKTTGLTPGHFKKIKAEKRKTLDTV